MAYLKPCVAAMAQLVKNYNAPVVLCTATQPALDSVFRTYLPESFAKEIQEICEKSVKCFGLFRRTTIVNLGKISKEEMVERLRQKEYENTYFSECLGEKIEGEPQEKKQVLCIVNRRKLAQELYETVSGEGCYCLTTLICPIERKRKFKEIKERLRAGKSCRVIATSLVEAGVDLDFPLVYRQEAGLDSLIQSAGRCNREGKRGLEESKVYSFRLEGEENRFLAQNIAALQETWRKYERIDAPEAIAFYFEFFRSLLGEENLDQKGILMDFEKGIDGSCFPFATVKEKFRLIENTMRTVLIPLEGTEKLLDQVVSGQADRNIFRKLGQYGVNVYENHFRQLWDAGCLEEIGKGIFVLRD
ncbi:MAG: CRISPR-associated helicase/endonuclease Cas3, partial [Lachnospiraceae bacterium]|nr:CRISPR-associated helicase/endonuclease Cas3 [Lachnospiraceae bacterium]